MQKPFGLDTHIRQQGVLAGVRKKRAKTRDALRLAAIHLLDKNTYLDIHVRDVCREACVGIGTFYRNYDSFIALIHELITDFVVMYKNEVATKKSIDRSDFSYMFHANRIYISFARDNFGLTRCFFQIADNDARIRDILMGIKNDWAVRVAHSVHKNADVCSLTSAVFVAQAMGSMTDDFVRRLVILKDKHLIDLCEELNLNDDRLAEYLATTWYRVLFLKDPKKLRFLDEEEFNNVDNTFGSFRKKAG